MARAHQTLKKWQLALTLLLGFLCTSLQAVPHSTQSHLGSKHFASQIASARCSEFAETLIREDRLIQLRLVSEITLRTTGDPIAFENPFRFSTKYTDAESGFLNYGRRLYNPTTGRWLSKDPIEEDGGLNLYGFVLNNPINAYDILGEEGRTSFEPPVILPGITLPKGITPYFYSQNWWEQLVIGVPYNAASGGVNAALVAGEATEGFLDFVGGKLGIAPGGLSAGLVLLPGGVFAKLFPPKRFSLPYRTKIDGADGGRTNNLPMGPGAANRDEFVEGLGGGDDFVTVRTYTDSIGKEGITESGHLRADTWVTIPDQIPSRAGHLQIEQILEIQPGRGTHFLDFQLPHSNLRIPVNGPRTSGGATQFQLNNPVEIDPRRFRRPPGRPARRK